MLIGLRPIGARLVAPLATPLRTVDIEYEKGHGTLGPVMEAIRETGGELDDLDIHDSDGGSTRHVSIVVRVPDPDDLSEIAGSLAEIPEVSSCKVRGANGHGVPARA